jgi:hypothetical protein
MSATITDKRTRARLEQLIDRASFDLKLAGDAARGVEAFALLKLLARQRRELEAAKQELQTTRYRQTA